MHPERRRTPRFLMKEDSFEVITHDSGLRAVVKDMGMGGLAFIYTPAANRKEDTNMIDILCRLNPQYCLHGVPCRTVYDIAVLSENRSFLGCEARRRGLKYQGLEEIHIQKLQHIFESGTKGPVGDDVQALCTQISGRRFDRL